jgi:hypothetical protein
MRKRRMENDWLRAFLNAVNNLQFCRQIYDKKNTIFHSDKQIPNFPCEVKSYIANFKKIKVSATTR